MRSTFPKSLLIIFFMLGVVHFARADKKSYNITVFNSIAVSNGINVKISQGTTESITAEGSADALAELDIYKDYKDANSVYIRRLPVNKTRKWLSGQSSKPITVYVVVKQLANLAVSGGSIVNFTSTLRTPSFAVALSGGSIANVPLTSQSLNCSLSGGSIAKFIGQAAAFTVQTSGGSSVNAGNLNAKAVTASASGGSTMVLYSTDNLTVAGSGGSTIKYRGNPMVQSSVNKSAVLTHIN